MFGSILTLCFPELLIGIGTDLVMVSCCPLWWKKLVDEKLSLRVGPNIETTIMYESIDSLDKIIVLTMDYMKW